MFLRCDKMKTIIALTHSDSFMGLEFMVQLKDENQIYRVAALGGDVASVFHGDREIFNCGNPNVHRTLAAYLRRRFHDFQIVDVSKGVK